jgi:hypothetical protein
MSAVRAAKNRVEAFPATTLFLMNSYHNVTLWLFNFGVVERNDSDGAVSFKPEALVA